MNKLSCLLLSLAAMAGYTQAEEALRVDFGTSATANIQEGYNVYSATSQNLASYTEATYSAFGTSVKVLPYWVTGAVGGGTRQIDRGANINGYGLVNGVNDPAQMDNLMRDWIGTNDNGTVGDPLTIKLTGLPAGTYNWTSYHHDTGNQTGVFDVTVNDAVGSVQTLNIDITCSIGDAAPDNVDLLSGATKFQTAIVSDGVTPVTIVFDQHQNAADHLRLFVMNGFDVVKSRSNGGAYNPSPAYGGLVDLAVSKRPALAWQNNLDDPNVLSCLSYDVYFGTEGDPNVGLNPKYTVTSPSMVVPYDLVFEKTYYWRVDTTVKWDTNIPNTVVKGDSWKFTTLPDDKVPVVTLDKDNKNVLTAMELLPSTVLTGKIDDKTEGDIKTVTWEVVSKSAVAAAKQIQDRTDAGQLTALDALITSTGVAADRNFLKDWIGTDAREWGNPMVLTIKGLPAGDYTWKSYHHDPEFQNGSFDVTVFDADYSAAAPGTARVSITNNASTTISTYTTSIKSNGADINILFEQVMPYATGNQAFFAMNGFELTNGAATPETMKVDFGTSGSHTALAGVLFYDATNETDTSFVEQSYTAFATTVRLLPTWGSMLNSNAVVTKTSAATALDQTASFATTSSGVYVVKMTATDNKQSVSDTMEVRVAMNACRAAQLGVSGFAFNTYDVNQDCKININDVASFANQWLNDRRATGQILN